MEFSNLSFEVKCFSVLSKYEKRILIDVYRKLFSKMYGADIVDAFLSVTKTDIFDIKDDYLVKDLAKNYKRAYEMIKEIAVNANVKILLIYFENKLVGSTIFKRINEDDVNVFPVALDVFDKKLEREIWKKTVLFSEKYFIEEKYKKMYLEIPLYDAPLLIRANDLGFKEDPEDIVANEEVYTYILNKNFEDNN